MKAIKITATNWKTLEEEFMKVNGKCSARLAHRWDAEAYVTIIEKSLIEKGLPKKAWLGLKFIIQPEATNFSNAYKRKSFAPMATQFTMEYKSTGWFIVSIERECAMSKKVRLVTPYTEEQKGYIVQSAMQF